MRYSAIRGELLLVRVGAQVGVNSDERPVAVAGDDMTVRRGSSSVVGSRKENAAARIRRGWRYGRLRQCRGCGKSRDLTGLLGKMMIILRCHGDSPSCRSTGLQALACSALALVSRCKLPLKSRVRPQ